MCSLFYIDQCSSTNDALVEILPYSEPDYLAVYTFNQTDGRGQYGNRWDAEAGKNLAYSIAVRCSYVMISHYLFNYYTAVLVRDFIANLSDIPVSIKWPNDIIITNKKVCGILIEKKKCNENEFFVVGIGINLLQEKFAGLSAVGSLFTQIKKEIDIKDFAENFHQFLYENLKKLPSEGMISDQFNKNLFRRDQISVFETENTKQNGIIRNADENGRINIEFEDGMRSFYHKEIKLLY